MAWEDELKKRDAKPVVCLEIELDTQAKLYFSDSGLREDDKYWEPRIQQVSPISRSIDPTNQSFQINEVSVSLDNNDDDAEGKGYFESLLSLHVFKNKTANIYLKFVAESGTVESKLIYSGFCRPKQIRQDTFDIEIRPKIMEKLKVIQRTIDKARFASAPDGTGDQKHSTVGQGMNIIFGNCSAPTGAVECPMIDESTGASWSECFVVAMHAVKSIDSVWRYRPDEATKWVTRIKDTHWREFKTAQDSQGDTYSYFQLATGQWRQGDIYYANVQGFESIGNGTGTLYQNPAEQLEKLLTEMKIDGESTLFDPEENVDLDSLSWAAADTEANARGYEAANYSAFAIPLKNGDNRIEQPDNQWAVLQDIARGFNHTLFVTTEGKIGITSIDVSQLDTTSNNLMKYREQDGDFQEGSSFDIELEPYERYNSVRVEYKHGHPQQNKFYEYVQADDTTSQNLFGVITDSVRYNRVARHQDMVEDVTERDVKTTSGETAKVTWTMPGLWGLQSEIGNIVELTHGRTLDWGDDKQVLITSITADLQNKTTVLTGLTVGDTLGPVKFSSQKTVVVGVNTSTFIGATQLLCYGGESFPYATASNSYGLLNHLRHGHHHAEWGVCDGPDYGYGNINWRTLLRFSLPSDPWSTHSIKSVSIKIQVMEIPNLLYDDYPTYMYRSNWTGGRLHKCNQTAWDTTSSWNSISFNDTSHVNIELGSFSGGTGTYIIPLNNNGLTMFQQAAAGNGQGAGGRDVNICLQGFSDGEYTNACIMSKVVDANIVYV